MTDTNERAAYSFDLPAERIAQRPAPRRDGSRLLVLPRRAGGPLHRGFRDLPGLLRAGDLLILNDTRVFAARVELRRETGGVVRGLLLDVPAEARFRMMLEGRGRLVEGDRLIVGQAGCVHLGPPVGAGVWWVEAAEAAVREELLVPGRMPLPPYIRREKGSDPRDGEDRERYQTIYATSVGAVAAPTAGLHFSDEIMEKIKERGVEVAAVTLHVGPGTFLPVRAENLADHRMHSERFEIPQATVDAVTATRSRGGRVVAVGTTVVRTLEGAALSGELSAGAGQTDIFIRPPFEFCVVDALITNFHLPESTLLMLVSAFAGRERILAAYREAVTEGYRFFSYGDAMFIC